MKAALFLVCLLASAGCLTWGLPASEPSSPLSCAEARALGASRNAPMWGGFKGTPGQVAARVAALAADGLGPSEAASDFGTQGSFTWQTTRGGRVTVTLRSGALENVAYHRPGAWDASFDQAFVEARLAELAAPHAIGDLEWRSRSEAGQRDVRADQLWRGRTLPGPEATFWAREDLGPDAPASVGMIVRPFHHVDVPAETRPATLARAVAKEVLRCILEEEGVPQEVRATAELGEPRILVRDETLAYVVSAGYGADCASMKARDVSVDALTLGLIGVSEPGTACVSD